MNWLILDVLTTYFWGHFWRQAGKTPIYGVADKEVVLFKDV